ncbi:MAG: mucoidy inhibitor MuiA family protein [Crocinitomicaceae bacterium]
MKRMILFGGYLIFTMISQANEIEIQSKIDKVKVFLTGAQVERSASAQLNAGRNRLIIKGVSAKLDEKSIQVRFEEAIKLMSVSTEIDYDIFEGDEGKMGELNDSLKMIEARIEKLSDIRSAIFSEKEILTKNQKLNGNNANVSVDQIEKAADFYRKRMEKINKELTDIKNESNELIDKKWMLKQKLDDLNFKESTRSNQIIMILDAKQSTKVKLNIEYFVSGCGWEPNYDLHASDLSGKITMFYKAKVFNDTGNDWEGVEMILSTGNPNLSATFPELSPWYLNYMEYLEDQTKLNGQKRANVNYVIPDNTVNWDMVVEDNEKKVVQLQSELSNYNGYFNDVPLNFEQRQQYFKKPAKPNVAYRTVEVSHLSSEFEIQEKYSIPSDKKPYLVEIKEHNLSGTFDYVAIPKMERDAYLLAQIPGWEQLDIVPGPTKVYFDGTYVGESYIDTRNVEDTLGLSFGRDSKIITDRKLLSEFSNKKVVGNNRKDSYTYELTIKNTRNVEVEMEVHDQIPVSQDSDITVTADEISGGILEDVTGIVSWKVKLGPNESKKFRISFTIKYPKDKKIQVRSFRKMSAPRFL